MKNKFFTTEGWLTRYAMACGYQHETEIDKATKVILSFNNPELNTFDIIKYSPDGKIWDVVEGINAARKRYRELAIKPARRYERAVDVARRVYA